MSMGTLLVSAFENTKGKPAENVSVSVSSGGNIIAQAQTNAEGQLEPVLLDAPPEELSLTPPENTQSPSADPFAVYDISAEKANGDNIKVTGVQVYENTVSLQNLFFPGQNDDIKIPDPAIMGGQPEKIPESEIKRLPDAGGTVVLPEPVVPGQVIVHAGVPSDRSAKNYTLNFTDYIKNVASSEIYATWPREALKANIIAIISFTLNRVYTEWYRGKGYDFTITSSTAYDQAFTYGRNIFSEISDVVDEVFNLYITRPDYTQPLFAQYCDGRRVKRSGWLSQWGSKELADKGYTAMRILQSYYGRDIVLRQARRVEGVPVSFSGTLSVGSRGNAVRTIQQQLNAISVNFPLIPKLAVDGIFGPKTRQSVRTFQQIFRLPETGSVDFSTWYRISDIYVAVRKLAENT